MGRQVSVEEPEHPGLEALNTLNMVIYNEAGLRQVLGGTPAVEVFSVKEKRSLVRRGILVRIKERNYKYRWEVPWAVASIIDRLK